MSYIGQIPLPQATEERIERTATAGQTSFTGLTYVNGHISTFINGVKLDNADFTATDGTTVTLATGAAAGDTVSFVSTTQTSALVALPLKDSAGNSILSESGGIVTFQNSTVNTTVKVNDGHTTDTINKFVAKAWANFQYQGTTFTQNSNFNLTISRNSTGSYYGTFTNAMSNNDYIVVVSSQVSAANPKTINVQQSSKSTTRTGTITFNESDSSVDPYDCSIVVFGD